jgi:threonine 3-dehydrogenase
MKALCKLRPEVGLWMIDAPTPQCGPDEVLIKISHTAICGTDIHIYNWDDWAAKTVPVGLITGHEFAGEIIEIGNAVTRSLSIGQRVSGEGHVIDLGSDAAREGHFHLDPNTKGVGVNRQGAFAQVLAMPAFNVVPLPDAVANELGALLDPFGNAVHTALKSDLVGADVLVTGAGPIGIMAAWVAKWVGARSVTITDVNPYRLALATRFAGIRAVNVGLEDLHAVRQELGISNGFDVALEMSGAAHAITQAIAHLKMGGEINMLGLPSKDSPAPWSDIIMKAITLRGVYGREMFGTWRKMLGLLEAGFPLERIITHRFGVDDFQAGFDVMRSGQSGKVVLAWN